MLPPSVIVSGLLYGVQHAVIPRQVGNWFDDVEIIHHRHEVDALEKARTKLRRERKRPDVGRIIAELNFGFWTSLLDRRYEQVLWPAMIKQVFPHMPRRQRTRVNLVERFNEVRQLRHRIFHHESIWYWSLPDKRAHPPGDPLDRAGHARAHRHRRPLPAGLCRRHRADRGEAQSVLLIRKDKRLPAGLRFQTRHRAPPFLR